MSIKRIYFILLALLGISFALSIGAAIFGNTYLKKKAVSLTNLKVKKYQLEEQQKSLVQAKKDVIEYEDIYQVTRSVVPQEKDQARTVIELDRIAKESGVKLSNISFPSSTLGQAAPKTTTPAPTDKAQTPETPQAAPAAPAIPATTQVKAVEGIAGVYQMEISLQSEPSNPITFTTLLNFLERLEQNRRTAQVANITVQPDTKNRNLLTFSIVINVYIKP